ncbi:hypothetical protein BDQ17DRAFT_1321508 [Cyathus striatus]|nr:hypothetical protein BDQ17DRAFT_1321508 [Cyathus striatus]
MASPLLPPRLDVEDDPLQGLKNVLAAARKLEPAAVATQVIFMSAFSILTILTFNCLRPKHKIIYQPKSKYHPPDLAPPPVSSAFFGWFPPLIHPRSQPPHIPRPRCPRFPSLPPSPQMALQASSFTLAALFACAILISLDYTYTTAHPSKYSDILTCMTIRDVKGATLYAHVGVTYLITLSALFLIHAYWKAVHALRNQWFRSLEYTRSFYARTLCITHVPKTLQSDEGVRSLLEKVKLPYPATAVHIGRKVGRLPELIEYHNNTCELQRTKAAVLEYRAKVDTRRAENYGFVSLAAIPYAHVAALSKYPASLFGKKIVGFFWLGLTCILSLIPLFPVATPANLDAITATNYLPFLTTWSMRSTWSYSLVSGILPPAVATAFSFFLPLIMHWLSQYMGAVTKSKLDRTVIARYFVFLVISQLIVFTLLGVVFKIVDAIQEHRANVKIILNNLDKLTGSITRTYVNQSSFWLKWFPMRGFLVFFDLAQIFNFLWISFKTRIFGRTPRDIREWTKPPSFEYAIYYSNLLCMAAVGLLFAPLAPLVALAAAIVFWLTSWAYKCQLMFVFVTKVESGGENLNVVIHSEHSDVQGHKLENGFGHPALYAELFTPMVHAKMIPLLKEVYKGKLGSGHEHWPKQRGGVGSIGIGGKETNLETAEGIKFAGIEQHSFQYLKIRRRV